MNPFLLALLVRSWHSPRKTGREVIAMGIASEYRATLKSVEVEEPIDLAVHRPLAFLVAKSAFRTPLTPNQLTIISMLLGVAGGLVLYASGPGHLFGGASRGAALAGGGLLFLSQVVDCSDGMLARMRRASSEIGRMLDGASDSVTLLAATFGSVAVMMRLHPTPSERPIEVALLAFLTVYTSSFHTAGYDHYKNVFLRMTVPQNHESDDLEEAKARYDAARRRPMPFGHVVLFQVYLGYLKSQRNLLSWFDPFTVTRLSTLPPYSDRTAAVYRRHQSGLMTIWRSLFGVGSLMFGLAVSNALGRPDLFLLFRLVVLNGVFFLYLMPAQRRASAETFRELGIRAAETGKRPLPV